MASDTVRGIAELIDREALKQLGADATLEQLIELRAGTVKNITPDMTRICRRRGARSAAAWTGCRCA